MKLLLIIIFKYLLSMIEMCHELLGLIINYYEICKITITNYYELLRFVMNYYDIS